MWGNYEVEMPVLSGGFRLFEEDLYLKEFSNDLKELFVTQNKELCELNGKSADSFVSGLGIRHKWSEPQEIGEITVGPYVPDIDMFNVCN